ncbi:MAG: hypothetical protein U0Z44_13265 [Kouleothrix sp.]
MRGLGDGAASNNTLGHARQLRLAAMLQKHTLGDARALPAAEARWRRWPPRAVRACWGRPASWAAPGALADIILVRIDGAHIQPIHNLPAALVPARCRCRHHDRRWARADARPALAHAR